MLSTKISTAQVNTRLVLFQNERRQEISKITSHTNKHDLRKEQNKIENEMSNALKPWKKILGIKNFKKLQSTARSQSARMYPIPKNSEEFVKRSWRLWENSS